MAKLEDKAIQLVIKYEKKQGRKPERIKKCYDVKSGNRYIEVKGSRSGKSPSFILVYPSFLWTLGKNIGRYYIYFVYNIKKNKNPKLLIIPPDIIFKSLRLSTKILLPRKAIGRIKEITLPKIRVAL